MEHQNINKTKNSRKTMFKKTCFDIWRKEQQSPKIVTLIKELDEKINGGIQLGLVTEFCGSPGSGKTQFCLQLCLNVQFPQHVGGLQGKAYFIDTNQGFSPHRLKEIAHSMERRFKSAFKSKTNNFNVKNLLQNISYVYCPKYLDLMATVLNLHNVLQKDKGIKLIVIDSFSFPLRQLDDVTLRTRIVYEILTDLQKLAMEYNVAIVITNELTTRHVDNNWLVCPALGDSHSHKINQRFILSTEENCNSVRVVFIEKSVVAERIAIRFQIKPGGIRSA